MFDDGSFFSKYGTFFIQGIGGTIVISLIGVLLGSLFGGILAFMKLSKNIIARTISWIYIEFIRGQRTDGSGTFTWIKQFAGDEQSHYATSNQEDIASTW